MTSSPLRHQVRQLYKNLLWIGREYPAGFEFFKPKLKSAFLKNKSLETEEDIRKAIQHGEFVQKELEALWFLKKYRSIKSSYYADRPDDKPGDRSDDRPSK
ncbi:putative growth hormone-inducible soluble protein [Polychytrium aggregatum]|uniref:putative growth hormone-inducible soluble protein n=1 Tax=Polychytrium aggregatum TaxID=110093 RepID=UPI0022FF01F4|nr:putative growth hormone-inducible soluble protein [Polychytrium aggregatum]KAI9203138.1 putative growth hormone-inducible soluble protein [Polychytrium aggregatum]